MQINNSSTRFPRLIALLACTSPGIATAQGSLPNFEGMWSDPPVSPELSFCFVGCVLEAFEHFTALLDDPMHFDETYVELEALAVEYQNELVPEYLTTTGLDGYPFDFEQNDPSRQCQSWGLALQMLAPHQMEITQYDDHIEILYAEWAARRTIYLDGRSPTDNGVSLLGHSVGRFEGETLVVETTNIRSDILFAGSETSSFTHSDQLRVTERYTKTQDDMRLEVVATFEDPIVLQEPLIIWKPWAWAPDEKIFEYECVLESD